MKLFAIGLFVCCAQANAQAVITNPAAVALSAQNAANALAVQQSVAANASRADTSSCVPLILVGQPEVFYIDPKEGHAPSWHSGNYDRSLPFQAGTWSGEVPETIQNRTNSMQTQPWANSDATTMKIASTSSSSASASSFVNQWSSNGRTTTESQEQTEVTVNGKTYRTFKHDINTTPPEPTMEPQSYNERVILCR
jgi:hypothetical protein